jgi:hypothetical protein
MQFERDLSEPTSQHKLLADDSGVRSPGDDGWEVVEKADSLQDGSHVGPASLSRPPPRQRDIVQPRITDKSKGDPWICRRLLAFFCSSDKHCLDQSLYPTVNMYSSSRASWRVTHS